MKTLEAVWDKKDPSTLDDVEVGMKVSDDAEVVAVENKRREIHIEGAKRISVGTVDLNNCEWMKGWKKIYVDSKYDFFFSTREKVDHPINMENSTFYNPKGSVYMDKQFAKFPVTIENMDFFAESMHFSMEVFKFKNCEFNITGKNGCAILTGKDFEKSLINCTIKSNYNMFFEETGSDEYLRRFLKVFKYGTKNFWEDIGLGKKSTSETTSLTNPDRNLRVSIWPYMSDWKINGMNGMWGDIYDVSDNKEEKLDVEQITQLLIKLKI